ncbi:PREDICTED: uncharacterized protein LOC104599037 [Nelumbo nucifera]|uniref:Uncharacterized protein LOC104599037 n=1 Tax=Nelumbo nucifera TaxID=4432 RepID=A0A1U7ZYS2_NELNU|nr:PREDICTED: uncharacterized protein LOC104599037 [Nelumbo nucifera]
MQLKNDLHHLHKGSKTMTEYLQRIKSLTDALEAAGHGLCSDDIILHTTGGLGLDYDPLVIDITARHDPLSIEELHSLLLQHERRLDHQHSALSDFSLRHLNSTQTRNLTTKLLSCFQATGTTNHSKALVESNTTDSSDGDWYPDTGATNHLIADLGNLSLRSDYTDIDKIGVGNGAVRQFCCDNSVIFEFDDSSFIVKDKNQGTPLLSGSTKDGLYQLSISPSSSSNKELVFLLGVCTTIDGWHKRLGHPQQRVVQHIF